MSNLKHAVEAVRRGFSVFPCIPNAKKPAIKDWPNRATTDPAQVRAWWLENPDYNIGGSTTGKLVLDVDPKNDGGTSLQGLMLVYEFPKTMRTETASGGAHVIYAMPPHTEVSNSAGRIADGIDVRGDGGYIVLPGSSIDGRTYKWGNDNPPAAAPEEIVALCKARRPKSEAAGKRLMPEDEDSILLSRRYLDTQAPTEVSEGRREDAAIKVAYAFYDVAVERSTCRELLTEWSEACCHPPLDDEALDRVSRSGESNRSESIGCRHPLAPGFEAVEIEERPASMTGESPAVTERPKFYAVRADDGARRALESPGEPLIKGVIHRGTLSVLVGAPGGGKTFFVLDWCYHIAKGLPWAGRPVKQGAVVYLAAEAGNMIMARLAALQAHYGPLGDAPLYVVPCPADFAHGAEDAVAVLALIQDVERKSGQKVELFVIDTLARAIAGGDENSSKDVGALIKAVDFIRDRAKTHALVIHHPGKDETKGGRGHSSVLGAADTEMVVSKHILTFTKQRDMPLGDSIPFGLRPIRIGTDAEGEAVTSCFVAVLESPERVDIPLTRTERELLEQIDEALQNTTKESFDWQWVQQNCPRKIRQKNSDKDSDKVRAKSSIIEPLSGLSEKGWLEKPYDNQYVRTCRKLSETVGN